MSIVLHLNSPQHTVISYFVGNGKASKKGKQILYFSMNFNINKEFCEEEEKVTEERM